MKTMTSPFRHPLSGIAVALGLLTGAGVATSLQAAEHHFQKTSGIHAWGDPDNWDVTGVPNAMDAEVFLPEVVPAGSDTTGTAQVSGTFQLGSLEVDLTGGSWGISQSGTGRLQWVTSEGLAPSLTIVKNVATSRSVTIGVGLLNAPQDPNEPGAPKALEIYGTGNTGTTLNFTGNNTGFTGGFLLKSAVQQTVYFYSEDSLGSNHVAIYNNSHKIRLGSGSGLRMFDNDIHIDDSANLLYLQTGSSAGGKSTLAGVISGNGSVAFEKYFDGALELTGENSYTGNTTLSSGINVVFHEAANFGTGDKISFVSTSGGSPILSFAAENTTDLTRKGNGDAREIDLTNATVTFDTGANDVTFANAVHSTTAGSGGFIKKGSGILRLQAANGYHAATQVTAGTLLVNNSTGSGTGASSVTVEATFGGNGFVQPGAGKAMLVKSGGVLSPGDASLSDGIGTLTIDLNATSENLSFEDGSRMAFDLRGQADTDRLSLLSSRSASVAFLGTTYLDFTDLSNGLLEPGSYTLISTSGNAIYAGLELDGTAITGGLAIGNGLDAYLSTLSLEGGNIVLNVQAIPEPRTTALLLFLGAGLLLGRRFHSLR